MSVFGLKGPQQRPGQPVKKTYHDCPGIDVARTLSAVTALFKGRTRHGLIPVIIPRSGP
jgi:hypothetical protein